jgi:hypothetical protein
MLINGDIFLLHHGAECGICHNGAGCRTLYPVFPQSYPQQLWENKIPLFAASAYPGLRESPLNFSINCMRENVSREILDLCSYDS